MRSRTKIGTVVLKAHYEKLAFGGCGSRLLFQVMIFEIGKICSDKCNIQKKNQKKLQRLLNVSETAKQARLPEDVGF